MILQQEHKKYMIGLYSGFEIMLLQKAKMLCLFVLVNAG